MKISQIISHNFQRLSLQEFDLYLDSLEVNYYFIKMLLKYKINSIFYKKMIKVRYYIINDN